eukprot:TRINITY_DN1826_c0_g1_i1.p1 TRINITY_DN1826_c0_g1~~TRINITY_DN1826_c0_g1_i1.p1  ORF type:complete len:455 (-),score=103.49 TRINITY_DN1826_c0_g1_i1:121-1485(-)
MQHSYSEQQIGRLKELLATSQKALLLGNSYYEQANNLYQICKTNCSKIDAAQSRFELIDNELNKQLQLIGQLVASLSNRISSFQRTLDQLTSLDEEIGEGVRNVFDRLKEKKVDPNLAAQIKTLHDYVDVESVTKLQCQTNTQIDDMKSLRNSANNITKLVESRYELLTKTSQEMRYEYKPTSNHAEKMGLQINEINAISYVLVSIAAQHDRVNHLCNNRDGNVIDLTAIERRTENELPMQISKIYDSLQRVQSIGVDVESKLKTHGRIYSNAVKVALELESFGPEIKTRLAEVDAIEMSFEQRKEETRLLFEELNNLITWYNLFYTAYHELIFEIGRRHRENRRQQNIVDAYQRELDLMWKVEDQKRDHFFEFYGKYLPKSICPPIHESAGRFQILSDRTRTDLPIVSEVERPSRRQVDLALSQMVSQVPENENGSLRLSDASQSNQSPRKFT